MDGARLLRCFYWLVSVKFSSHAWYLLCAQREFSKIIAYFHNPSSPFCCILIPPEGFGPGEIFQSIWLKTKRKWGNFWELLKHIFLGF